MTRRNQVLIALLIVQLGLVGFVWLRPRGSSGPAGPLLPEVTPTNVTRLTIQDNTGKQVVLAKSGGTWVLPELDDFPVDRERIDELLEKLPKIRTNRLVAETPTSHRRLKVAPDDFERKLTIEIAGGKSFVLWVGTTAGARTSHVRLEGEDRVYLADDLASWQLSVAPTGWIDTLYFQTDQDELVAWTLENAHGTFTFRKSEGGTWAMDGLRPGETLDTSKVSSLAGRLHSLYLSAPVGKEKRDRYGLNPPQATLTLTLEKKREPSEEESADQEKTAETVTLKLFIGAKDEENNGYYVFSPDSKYPDYVVRVAAYNVREFVENGRKDFLKEEDNGSS